MVKYLVVLENDLVIGVYDDYDEALTVASKITKENNMYATIYHVVRKEVIEW